MKALICETFGPLEQLHVGELPAPAPAAGEVVIDIHACGVNFPDVLIAQGLYQVKPPLPFSPGCEVAGTIAAVAEGVRQFEVGDRVIAWLGYGGYAEQVAVPATRVFALPETVGFAEGSALLLTYGTAYHALHQRASLQGGETVAVLGAGGGVGLACVELANAAGAKVIACASSEEKLALARTRGATAAINYREQPLRDALKSATGGRGVDVICDPVGGELTEAAFRSIAWGGRHLVLGFAAGEIPRLPLNLPLLKGASLVGVFWGRFTESEAETNQANTKALLGMMENGEILPHVSRTFALPDTLAALHSLSAGEALGKYVVRVRGDD